MPHRRRSSHCPTQTEVLDLNKEHRSSIEEPRSLVEPRSSVEEPRSVVEEPRTNHRSLVEAHRSLVERTDLAKEDVSSSRKEGVAYSDEIVVPRVESDLATETDVPNPE